MLRKIHYDAPVTLSFALISLAALLLGFFTGGKSTDLLFCVYRSPLTDVFTYVRLFGHVLGHTGVTHYIGNMMLLLLLGPVAERAYGSKRLLGMIAITAALTGLVSMILFPRAALLGASGVVFLLIMLTSLINYRGGRIPLSFILVAVLYLGQEIYAGFTQIDGISQLTHILGGVLGLFFGLSWAKERR